MLKDCIEVMEAAKDWPMSEIIDRIREYYETDPVVGYLLDSTAQLRGGTYTEDFPIDGRTVAVLALTLLARSDDWRDAQNKLRDMMVERVDGFPVP
jgi:hypothetical protein